jgi:RND family efflux transporter MFP subunit
MKMFTSIFSKLKGSLKWFQTASLKKKIIVIVVVGVLLFLISGPLLGSKNQSQVSTDTVKKATIIDTVSESGNIQTNQVNIYPSTNGVITNIYVQNGQEVKQGNRLFSVKSTATAEDKAKAYASYQSAQSAYQQALNNRRNTQAAVDLEHDNDKNYGSGETFAQKATRTATEVANDNAWDTLKTTEGNLTSAHLAYAATQDSTTLSPITGTIANLGYSEGNNVSALSGSGTTSSGTPVLIVGTAISYELKIQLSETEINKIQVGEAATITVNAIKDKTYTGEVTRVDDYGTDTSGVITYNVYVRITDPDDQIKPLMSAVITIQTAKHENALVVPNSAIKPYKGGKAVQVKDTSKPGNQLKYIQVKTGIKSTNETEILEGVTEGMEVVISTTTTSTKSSGGLFGGPPGN